METLILTAEHRNQYYEKKCLGHGDGFRSSAPFRQINCRTFHYGVGLLPRPKRTTKGPQPQPQPHSPPSPKSVLPVGRTRPIPIANSSQVDERRSLSYSELWAGPTYSNSPPPTSLPLPNLSLRQKRRTVSLTFPAPEVAPVSPTSSADYPFHTTLSATMTLRRMLNLQ